jgi:hypothetical protein
LPEALARSTCFNSFFVTVVPASAGSALLTIATPVVAQRMPVRECSMSALAQAELTPRHLSGSITASSSAGTRGSPGDRRRSRRAGVCPRHLPLNVGMDERVSSSHDESARHSVTRRHPGSTSAMVGSLVCGRNVMKADPGPDSGPHLPLSSPHPRGRSRPYGHDNSANTGTLRVLVAQGLSSVRVAVEAEFGLERVVVGLVDEVGFAGTLMP